MLPAHNKKVGRVFGFLFLPRAERAGAQAAAFRIFEARPQKDINPRQTKVRYNRDCFRLRVIITLAGAAKPLMSETL